MINNLQSRLPKFRSSVVGRCVAFLMLTLWSLSAIAQVSLLSLTGAIQSGVDVVRIEMSESVKTLPKGFVIQSPARIVLDFPGVVNGVGRNAIEIGRGKIRSANVIQSSERTRVVINLSQSSNYQTKIDGKSLLVLIENAEATPSKNMFSSASLASFSDAGGTSALKYVDFQRGSGNVGRVVVDLANSQTGVDIRQQGKDLVVDFLKSSLPEGLKRKLDVSDFGTPVQTVVTRQEGDRVRMLVTPVGNWEHSAYQSDNRFVLEVREQKVDPEKLTQGTGYNGEKLSLNFQNIEVRSLLQVIADFTNFNIVTSDSVSGAVTLRLKDVPWDQALDIILQARGLGVRKSGNVLWIAPKDEIAAREKQGLEAKASVESLETLRTQSFQMNYAKASEVAAQLMNTGGASASQSGASSSRLISARGSVIAEPRTNQLFVTDIPSRLDQVQQFITKLDIPVRQVLIEARIVEADDTFGRALGVRLGGADLRGVRGGQPGYDVGGPNRVAVGGSYNAVTSTTTETGNNLNSSNSTFVNLPVAGVSSFAVSLFSSAANRFLNLEISAAESDGRVKLVSSPRVVTADQVKAIIESGTEIPYQTATSSGATAVTFRKASLKLEVTPQITPEGGIILDVNVSKDSPGVVYDSGVAINTKNVKTQVLVENGGTVVIGGIFSEDTRDTVNKVPLFGDIPFFGHLFKNKTSSVNKTELLIFISPRSISNGDVPRR